MRCPDCNKFVSFDSDLDPEVSIDVDADGMVSGTVRIVNACDQCGQELKEATFEIDVDLSEEMKTHILGAKENGVDFDEHAPECQLEASRTDRMNNKTRGGKLITNYRYMKHMYGAEGEIVLTCSCGEEVARQQWSDEVQGSGMDELV